MRIIILPFAALACSLQAHAQAGTLDMDFSTDGLFAWDLSSSDDQISAVIVQPDDKIVGAGWVTDGSFASIAVQRLMPDGTPDPGFGTGGLVYSNSPDGQYFAYAVGVQSTGKIVVAGLAYDINFDGNVLLLRYLSDGTPDAGFGTGGALSTDLGGGPGFQAAWAMRIMADDRIVVVGDENANGAVCARFTPDGDPDPTFGTNGVSPIGLTSSTGLCMDLYDDGSVIAGGYYVPGASDWMLARFDAGGVLDPSFGVGGVVTTSIGNGDTEFMRGISVMDDGRIAACGSQSYIGLDDEPIIALFNDDGTPDSNFGSAGVVVLPFVAPLYGQARAIATPEGKLLVAGFRAQPGVPNDNDFFLYRLLDDGTLDPSFAGNGQVYTDVTGSFDRAFAMALAPDGDIVLAGYGFITERATGYARYVNDLSTGVRPVPLPTCALTLFPVPASDILFLDRVNRVAGQVTTTLWSSDGRCVLMVDHGKQPAGMQRLSLDLPKELRIGIYTVQVAGGGTVDRAQIAIAGSGH
ncbi:MAG: hypothetical protein ABI599_11675 [Flavobacteriales bacterium]